MIPKKIHYCWFGGNPIPENLKKCIDSWKKVMPDYEIIKWDETNFDVSICKYVKQAYENKKWAFVSDYARLFVIYNYGGIYLDTDVEVVKKFDNLLKNKAFMGFEQAKKKAKEVNTGIGFGAEPGFAILKEMLEDYDNRKFVKEDGSLDMTPCPQIQTKILIEHGLKTNNEMQKIEDLLILPSDYLCPMNQYTGNILITNNTYSIHRYFDSWDSKVDKQRRQLRMKYSKYGYFISNIISTFIAYKNNYGNLGMWKEILKKIRK